MFKRAVLAALVALLATVAIAPAFAANDEPRTRSNGYVVVYNSLDSRANVWIYLSGSHEDRSMYPKQSAVFNYFCCYVAGTTYVVRLHHTIDVDHRVIDDGREATVKPRLCTDRGLLYGYAHMTIFQSKEGAAIRQDDSGCP